MNKVERRTSLSLQCVRKDKETKGVRGGSEGWEQPCESKQVLGKQRDVVPDA